MATWGSGISLKGADGKAGSQIFFGTGTPSDGVSAVEGDIFFAQDTGTFWQRGASGWPASGTSVIGPKGDIGLNGVDGNFYTGSGAPDASIGTSGNSLYVQTTGEVWTRQSGGDWVDSGESMAGPQGQSITGPQGLRGTQTYTGHGAPATDLSTFNPPAEPGDIYYDLDGGPALYVLGA